MSAGSARRHAAVLSGAYYAALFFALGAHLPFWPIWLADWGLDEAGIGALLGAATLVKVAGGVLIPVLADRLAWRRGIVTGCALATSLIFAAHHWIAGEPALLVATLLVALVMAPTIPLGEALGIRASETHGFAYGPVRAAGSLTFLAMNVLMGVLIGRLGPQAVLWAVSGTFLVVSLLGAIHPGGGAPPGTATDRAQPGDVHQLVTTPAFICFALVMAAGHASHVVYYVYSALAWQTQGIPPATIGWLWAIGVLAETMLLVGPGRHWVARIGPVRAIAVAAFAGVLRWTIMAGTPPLWALWPVQALHALTFGLAHLGAIAFVARAVPTRLTATAQGLSAGLIGGLAMSGAAFLAAGFVAEGGIARAYWLPVVLSALACAGAVLLGRLWRGGRIVA